MDRNQCEDAERDFDLCAAYGMDPELRFGGAVSDEEMGEEEEPDPWDLPYPGTEEGMGPEGAGLLGAGLPVGMQAMPVMDVQQEPSEEDILRINVVTYHQMGYDPTNIAYVCDITEEEVEQILWEMEEE